MSPHELPPMNALRAFEAVARLQSVTLAAAELHVTHGAVSRQLRLLDQALGQPLFARHGRGLRLTAPGEQLHEAAGTALEQIRHAWMALRHNHTGAPLVLGCSGSVLARWVIPRLDRLNQDLPDLPLHLSAQEQPLRHEWGQLDAALLLAAPPWPPGWQVRVLATEHIGPVVSPNYQGWTQLAGKPASVLSGEPLLHTTSRPQAWRDWARASGITQPLSPGQEFAHLYYLLEAAIAGLGVAIAPAPLVSEDLASGRLIAPWGFERTEAAWILAAPRRLADPRLGRLGDWLEGEFSDTSGPAQTAEASSSGDTQRAGNSLAFTA